MDVECPSCGLITDLPAASAGCIGSCKCGQKFRIPPRGGPSPAFMLGVDGPYARKGGCLPALLEVVCTICSAGVLGGVGRLAAGKGPGSLVLSLVVAGILGLVSFLSLGIGTIVTLPVWLVFVLCKLTFDLLTALF